MERVHINADSHLCLQSGVKGAHILTLATRLWGYGTVTPFEQGMHSNSPQSPPGPIVSSWGHRTACHLFCLPGPVGLWLCHPDLQTSLEYSYTRERAVLITHTSAHIKEKPLRRQGFLGIYFLITQDVAMHLCHPYDHWGNSEVDT